MASKSFEKLVQEIGGMTVLELSDFVKELETTFGVSAAMPTMAAAPVAAAAAAPAAAEEKSSYKVTLQDGGSDKIKVIKALRQVAPQLSLGDAKKAVEEAPSVIAESASKDDAKKMKETLEAAGAKVQLA
ncbi:50S ribosomal protein L7/L12 [Candidatus Dependentiae bacterium]|nr:50S ribosomal protein L7/L12 [Candidatus Dependentiae bacterium]MCC7414492.1 50S ribosomal protein L7/L12 [Campylobacterota bacterium]